MSGNDTLLSDQTDRVLQRLESVRQAGTGRWIARCPAHDDRSPSLSIRELNDGTILIHDFGGCDALSIVQAIGLEFADLFPARRIRRVDSLGRPRLSATDALVALDHEITTAVLIITDLIEHREIDEPTWERLALVCSRIGSARIACCMKARL